MSNSTQIIDIDFFKELINKYNIDDSNNRNEETKEAMAQELSRYITKQLRDIFRAAVIKGSDYKSIHFLYDVLNLSIEKNICERRRRFIKN